jgi:hypothetical protein
MASEGARRAPAEAVADIARIVALFAMRAGPRFV